ncbi:MAG: tetratricopeptide repeat protein [Rubrobacteraceae bacterium]
MIFRISAGFLVLALILLALSLYLSDYYLGEQQRLAAAEDEKGAISQARIAARLDPFGPEPLQAESGLLQRQGRNKDAVESLERATARDPHNYLPYALLGSLQLNQLNDYEAATESYRKARELNPNATTVSTALAQSLLRQEKFKEAERVYEGLRKDGQMSIESLYNLGRIYVREGQPEKGREILEEARRYASTNLESLEASEKAQREEFVESINLSIADALVVEGQYDEARQIVSESSSEQASAILALIDSDPDLYRRSVKNGEIY